MTADESGMVTLEKGLGDAFTSQVCDACAACIALVAAEMVDAAAA